MSGGRRRSKRLSQREDASSEKAGSTLRDHFPVAKATPSSKNTKPGVLQLEKVSPPTADTSSEVIISQDGKKAPVDVLQESKAGEAAVELRFQDLPLPPQGVRGPVVRTGEPFDMDAWNKETYHNFEGESQEVLRLREFDVDSSFGPTAGMTRLQRWNRAQKLGLNPPQDVLDILLQTGKL